MFFGAHVSIAGGIFNAPLNAAAIGCEVFQMFSRSPHGGPTIPLTDDATALFKQNIHLTGQRECYIHAPYFINFASANNRIFYGSISAIRQELERGSQLGARYVMMHPGSFKGLGTKKGFDQVVVGLAKVLAGYDGSAEMLIEISAGAGDIIGETFEGVAAILDHPSLMKFPIGVCYDTQHGFASGYDIRTPEKVKETFDRFDAAIGLGRLKMFHCNDSKVEFGSNRDRHEHIGDGYIGRPGFEALLSDRRLKGKNFIVETEHDKVKNDLQILKEIRKKLSSL